MFTGALSVPRHTAQSLIEEKGGIAGSSVTSSTDYLVVGSKPGSKLWKAQSLGTKILTEVEFWKLLEPQSMEAAEEEVVLTQDQLEGIEVLPWSKVASLGTTIMLSSQLERLLNHYAPSYLNPAKLRDYQDRYPFRLLPPKDCSFCGKTIPYSIHPKHHYCFYCNQYSDQLTHNHCWIDPEISLKKTLSGKVFLVCRLCREFLDFEPHQCRGFQTARRARNYHSSVEKLIRELGTPLHALTGEWSSLDFPTEGGQYWMRETDGKVIFVGSVELEEFADFVDSADTSPSESTESPSRPCSHTTESATATTPEDAPQNETGITQTG